MTKQTAFPLIRVTYAAFLTTIFSFACAETYAAPAPKTPNNLQRPERLAPADTTSGMETISTGQKADLKLFLVPEQPTVFSFYKPSSTLERQFVSSLQKETNDKVSFRAIQLKTGSEAIAQQYQIRETPTILVFDRRARLVGRSSNAEEIRTLIARAARVMRIDWAEEGDPRLDKVREMMGGRPNVPDILRTMSLRPDYLQGFMAMSMRAQFTDGFIDRRTKELIATYVSAINKCKY